MLCRSLDTDIFRQGAVIGMVKLDRLGDELPAEIYKLDDIPNKAEGNKSFHYVIERRLRAEGMISSSSREVSFSKGGWSKVGAKEMRCQTVGNLYEAETYC